MITITSALHKKKQLQIPLTRFTNDKGFLTKTFSPKGVGQAPNFYCGTFETLVLNNLSDLKKVILDLEYNQALSYSTVSLNAFPSGCGTITTKGNEVEEKNTISKTKDYFQYQAGNSGILFIDIDKSGLSEEDAIAMLAELYEPFGGTSYLYATSASYGLRKSPTSPVSTFYHLYFVVEEIASISDAMKHLFNLSFVKNVGAYAKVTKSGGAVFRSFFDLAVYDNARMDFISGANCIDGLATPERDIHVVSKGNDTIDLSGIIPPDDRKVKDSKAIARELVKPEVVRVQKKAAKARNIPLKVYQQAMSEDAGTLALDYILPDGSLISDLLQELLDADAQGVTIKDRAICHPVDFTLDADGNPMGEHLDKTMIYFNQHGTKVPTIHSFKHGGQRWSFDMPKAETKRFPTHPETEKVIQLMQETYTGRGQELPVATVKPMIDLMLHQVVDDAPGKFSISLRPSAGKTQTMLHVAWYLSERVKNATSIDEMKVRSMSLTFQQISDIEEAYDFLSERGVNVAAMHSKAYHPASGKKMKVVDLQEFQIILHTHFRLRDNHYTDRYFSYQGEKRDGFIFDEAFYGSLHSSLELSNMIGMLSVILADEEKRPVGLPVSFLKDLLERFKVANRSLSKPHVKKVTIDFPKLSQRFVERAWRISDINQYATELHTLMLIATAKEKVITASKEKGCAGALLMYKANDASTFDKLITTDATRDVRRIHKLSPQKVLAYDCLYRSAHIVV